MRQAILVAALSCAALAPDAAVRAQEWGGAAGVAAMRGYSASPGVAMTGSGGASAPAAPTDAAAVAPEPGTLAPARPVAGLAGDVPRSWRAIAARPRHGHGRRRSRRV